MTKPSIFIVFLLLQPFHVYVTTKDPAVFGGVTTPEKLMFGPDQVPPLGVKFVTIKGAVPGQAAFGVPALIDFTVTTTESLQDPTV
jgi:hypothetical protein